MNKSRYQILHNVSLSPLFLALFVQLMLTSGCSILSPKPVETSLRPQQSGTLKLAYTIEVGAFSEAERAAHLSALLEKQGVKAYYFRHSDGLYKVRFGNYLSIQTATEQAENFLQTGMIADYCILRAESNDTAHNGELGENFLRQKLLDTAVEFVGIGYNWGGTSKQEGFDCSGLTMAVYQVNGLNLPRTSKGQFQSGKPVAKQELKKGDLVFFATRGGKRITHVGIYAGNGTFIHAPGKGKRIETASLFSDYFASRYVGARTYLNDS